MRVRNFPATCATNPSPELVNAVLIWKRFRKSLTFLKLKSIFRFMKRLSFLEQSSFQIVTLAQRLYEKAQRNCSRQSSTLPMLLLRQGLRREERFREPRQRHPLEGEVLRVSHLSQELQILQQPISSPENPTRKRRDCSDSQAG